MKAPKFRPIYLLLASAPLSLVVLVLSLTAAAQTAGRQEMPQLPGRYCDTASPLSLVWVPSAKARSQRLLPYTSNQMLLNSDGRLAVLSSDDYGLDYLVVYKSGKRLLKKYLGSRDNGFVGWYHDAVVFRGDGKLRTVNVPTGRLSAFDGPEDTVRARSLRTGDILMRDPADGTVVEFLGKDGRKSRWSRPVGLGDWTVVANRYLAIECWPEVGDTVDTTQTRLWIIDLKTSHDRMIDVSYTAGLVPGRSADELVFGLSVGSKLRITALDLKSLKRQTLATVGNGATELVGLSQDLRWALLNTGYADVGPGYLWAINLTTGKTVRVQENIYGCLLSP